MTMEEQLIKNQQLKHSLKFYSEAIYKEQLKNQKFR